MSALENEDENQVYLDLITNMTKMKRTERPTIENVLNHPMFWNIEKVLNIFRVISNFFPKFENDPLPKSFNIKSGEKKIKDLIKDLKDKQNEVYGDDWLDKLCPEVQKFEKNRMIHARKGYNHRIQDSTSFIQLLHYIVDKERHLREWPIKIKHD